MWEKMVRKKHHETAQIHRFIQIHGFEFRKIS